MGHLAAGDLGNALHGVLGAGVDGVLNAQGAGEIEAFLHKVQQDGVRAVGLGHHAGHQADGPGADDGAVFTGFQAAAVDAVQADGQRLGHGGLFPAHAVGDLDEHIGRVAVILGHAAVDMHAQHL